MDHVTTRKGKKRIHTRSGWSEAEEALLAGRLAKAQKSGEALRIVFEEIARQTGRQPNSVRNYYYTVLRPRLAESHALKRRPRPAFKPFEPGEARSVLKAMLGYYGEGLSIRASALKLARGDRSAMLRYQNKYRSLAKSRPDLLEEIQAELRSEGRPVRPIKSGGVRPGEDLSKDIAREVGRILSLDATQSALLRLQDAQARAESLRLQTYRLASLTQAYLDSKDEKTLCMVRHCIAESLEFMNNSGQMS